MDKVVVEPDDSVFRAALELVPIGLVLARWEPPRDRGSFRFEWGNRAAKEITGGNKGGMPLEEYIGKTLAEAFPTLMETELPDKYVAAMETGQPQELGSLRYGEAPLIEAVFRIQVIRVTEDMIAIAYENITERVRAEEGRDATLRELEISNKDLNDFAYVASHDLKAPLRDVHSLADWICQDAKALLPDKSRAHLDTLRQRVSRMEDLLEDLLAYSRAGRIHPAVESTRLQELLDDVIELSALPPAFQVQRPTCELQIRTPKAALALVLRNLLCNAAKHHDREKGCIEIRVDEGADEWQFHVIDDGPGIPDEYHQRIFGMFQSLRPRDEVEGTGMGLALCKKTVEAYGGSIDVDSTGDRGATFSFTWPKTWAPPHKKEQ